MKVTSRVNNARLRQINSAAIESLILTGEAVKDDLIQSQTMPFGDSIVKKDGTLFHEGGHLQNKATFVDNSEANAGKVSIISDTPYARRLYYHPEYNFSKKNNPNAGGMWFEPYINGNKKDYAKKVFARFLRSRI